MFTKSLADRLNGGSHLTVREAEDREPVEPGKVLISPGGKHLSIKKIGGRSIVSISSEPADTLYKPCVDVMFHSVEVKEYPVFTYPPYTLSLASHLFEVIEHLKDPLSLLKECKRLLKPEGIPGIRTGNTDSWTVKVFKGKWHYFNIDKHGGHISFFNKKSMFALAQKADFKVERFQTYRVSYCEHDQAPYLIYRLLKILADLSNLPAKLSGKGHEMRVYLRNPSS